LKRNALRFKNLHPAYCVNCRNTNIPGYCCQWNVFCDYYRNMGISFVLWKGKSVLWTSICIASSATFPLGAQILRNTRTVAQWNLILAYLQHSKAMEKHANKKLF